MKETVQKTHAGIALYTVSFMEGTALYIPLFILSHSQTVHCTGKRRLGMIIFLYALFLPHLFFSALLLLLRMADVDVFGSLGSIYEQCDTVIHNLGKARAYCKVFPLVFSCKLQLRSAHRNSYYHILMVWQDSFLSVRSRDDEFPAPPLVKNFIACYDLQTKCIHYACTPVLFCVLSLPAILLWLFQSHRLWFRH